MRGRGLCSAPSQRHVHRANETFAQTLLADLLDVAAAGEQGVHDRRVPLDASALLEDVVDLPGGKSLPVESVAGHGVERVCYRQNARLKGDFLAREVVWVSLAVHTLMVVTDGR